MQHSFVAKSLHIPEGRAHVPANLTNWDTVILIFFKGFYSVFSWLVTSSLKGPYLVITTRAWKICMCILFDIKFSNFV